MTTLQASLLCKPSLFLSFSLCPKQRMYSTPEQSNSLCKLPSSSIFCCPSRKLQFRSRSLSIPCTLQPENANLSSMPDSVQPESKLDVTGSGVNDKNTECVENSMVSEIDSSSASVEFKNDAGNLELEEGDKEVNGEERSEKIVASEGQAGNLVGKEVTDSRIPLVAFLMGLWVTTRKAFQKVVSEFLSRWPFWRQEKKLDHLIAEADADPKNVAKQSALLAELNKHSPELVIQRFEQREHAVDSRGVAEYLRALVVTNAIAEYLPDEGSGKPSSLPTLVIISELLKPLFIFPFVFLVLNVLVDLHLFESSFSSYFVGPILWSPV